MAHVLIIDDDDLVSELIKGILEEAGHTSDRAAAAYGATLRMLSSHYDLVLMDLLLQGANGAVAALALRGMGYLGPIVVVSGNTMPINTNLYDLARFNGRVLKPFKGDELVAEVNRQLSAVVRPVEPIADAPMVLVVEDSQEYGIVLTKALVGAGFGVDLVPSAEAALVLLNNRSYAVALVDIILPGEMSGVDLVKASRLAGCTIPMIAISGLANDPTQLASAGFAAVLDKTVGIKTLIDTVRAYTSVDHE